MRTNVFAYGSLQLSAVMTAVTGRRFVAVPAQLPGYARYSLRNRRYPGLRARRGYLTEGVLYRDVDALSLLRLDAFEDAFYRRRRLTVFSGREHPVLAEVYVIDPANYRVLGPQRWELAAFRRRHLKPYLRRCRRGCAAPPRDVAVPGAHRAVALRLRGAANRASVSKQCGARMIAAAPGNDGTRGHAGFVPARGGEMRASPLDRYRRFAGAHSESARPSLGGGKENVDR